MIEELANRDYGYQTVSEGSRPHDPYIRLGDVLSVHRAHFPGDPKDFPEFSDRRRGPDDCQVLLPREICQFAVRGPARWANYREIVRHFGRRADSSHRTYYRYEDVFAPAKIVLRESDRPIKALLADHPVYPERGKLAVLRQPWLLPFAYIALGVLNSAIGLSYYHTLFQLQRGRPSRASDDLQKRVLEQIPLVHRDAESREIDATAALSYRISMLSAAEQDCRADFSDVMRPLRIALLSYIATTLRLQDTADALIDRARKWHATDAPDPQLALTETLQSLPPIHQIHLLKPEDRKRSEELGRQSRRGLLSAADDEVLHSLWRREAWEHRINSGLPKRGGLLWPPTTSPGSQALERSSGRESGPTPATVSPTEAQLLLRASEGLSQVDWKTFHALQAKRDANVLTPDEWRTFTTIAEQIEIANVDRIQNLRQLAELRNTDLRGLMSNLGMVSP